MPSMERIQPHSEDAEKSVLGSIILDKDALFDVAEMLKPEDFYSEAHKEIYSSVIELFRKNTPIDLITVGEELKVRKLLEMVGGRPYLAYLSTVVLSTSNATEYAKIIQEKAILRNLIKASSDIMEKSYQEQNESSEVLDYAEKEIFEIAQKRQNKDFTPIKDVIWDNILPNIDKMSKGDSLLGITTGFADLDRRLSGLQKSDLIIIAARPSMGKTALALNIAKNAATKGEASIIIFSLEMSKEQLTQRLLSVESGIEISKIRHGDIDKAEWDDFNMAVESLAQSKIFIDDSPASTVFEMKNKCRRLKAESGLDLVIVDYLQLMGVEGKSESRQQEITAISRYLKQLAREMECPVVALSQLSRAPEQRSDHRPMLSDLRESGSIEQDADIVMFLYRDDYYYPESDKPNICEVIIAKQRNGPVAHEELAWVSRCTKFADISKT